jgi:predicted O-methyltransferase YrrM
MLNTRNELHKIIPPDAIGVEVGVAAGYFSDILLSSSNFKRLYSIDAWADHHDSKEYIQCVSTLAKHGSSSVVMRMFFDDALAHFPDEFFDFVYVDGYAHTGQEDGQLFDDWYPKLKKGGIFSGHDYDNQKYPQTVVAVDRFAATVDKEVIVIPASCINVKDMHPGWYFIK